MPYEWIDTIPTEPGAPSREMHLWPHRSLSKRGFAALIGCTFLLLLLPLYPALGSPVLWGLLPFLMGTLWFLYWAIQRSYRDGDVLEELRIWSDRVTLVRHAPHRPTLDWEANPHWVEVRLHETGGPVANYVTLRGNNREVQIGAFLSEEERLELYNDLNRYLPAKG